MANITLSELNVAGSQLFQDSESFLNDLSDVDLNAAHGGNNANYYDYDGSDSYISVFNKLIEGFVDVYAIQHIFSIAKSFSKSNY
ncbi:hypothetical protein IQ244_25620 [Nostoc sp. LEGE 06077]|uniref:hypothetical protein n=1 Tax=Nostoc sp. LEGE 06077 TaxID=915325 RepID=UPI00187FB434|nr:hypothetical protein [Nostoc sp. LEGE 06077]MBE9209811.1 hypothetical protein [Nostoc sp. LEGE 06077]